MKKLNYIIILGLLLTFIGCSEDFLDRKSLTTQADENYYSNPQQIEEALASAYSKLTNNAGANNYNMIVDIMSDDRVGGGGINDLVAHDADLQTNSAEDTYLELWRTQYEGIFRANMIISRFDQAQGYSDEITRNRDLGEAYFLRGYFYLRLALLFGTVPVITDPAPVNYPRATPEELFGQIASDLKTAIELMPDVPITSDYYAILGDRNGHASKWAAQGIMARAFLFYTGYYGQTEIALPEGGTVTQEQVLTWLKDCIENSGHILIDDPRNLWAYTAIPDSQYVYNEENNLEFAGDGNAEIMFMVKYASFSNWNRPGRTSYSNQGILYQGWRMNIGVVPFGGGWGMGPVNPQVWGTFEAGDVRKDGFILSLVDDVHGDSAVVAEYIWGGELADPQYQETGYWSKKGMPAVLNLPNNGEVVGYYYNLFGGNRDKQHWNMQDDPILRFADVLLMAAELGSDDAQVYMDAVRTRAGLDPVAPTLDNIKLERRHEFFGEGLRYHDLLRWHDAEEAFATATNFTVWTGNAEETYTMTFDPARAFLKIPESQIRLSADVLVQDPAWE
jgi:hypothetical protein